jgi:hypothetical protein
MKARKINAGDERLIPREQWCPAHEIQGTDRDVLLHPTMRLAFERVLEVHEVRHPIAVMALCTSRRPYTATPKWRTLRGLYGDSADLIVTSNGGIVPLDLERCYPFLTYDAKGERWNTPLYQRVLKERLLRFLRRHRYRFVVFVYRPTLRNVPVAHAVCRKLLDEGALEEYEVLPTPQAYARLMRAGIREKMSRSGRIVKVPAYQREGFTYCPEVHPIARAAVDETIKRWRAA